ncbi:unnamed protein product [Echinostoma caproni]|uniref:Helicase C-terminal domain-containing protein n=1 Tax=Echinostoma caproni TaxID=27848 RepID=A0A3P8HA37_9TREM|nr:unnamed protein product [Echinostoma caproni]
MTVEEREVVENGFRAGLIRVLVATSTLSSGVNLPARRVIIRTPLFHGQILDYLTYKQMAGRAGRKGVDTSGQSILLCKPRDLPRVRQLITSGMSSVSSCLMSHGGSPESSLRRALLEVIANGFIETVADARLYLSSTLMAASQRAQSSTPSTRRHNNRRKSLRLSQTKALPKSQTLSQENISQEESDTDPLLIACLAQLQDHELIYVNRTRCTDADCQTCQLNAKLPSDQSDPVKAYPDCARLQPTALGRAVLSSSLGPTHGLVVFEEMNKARRAIALDTELHLVYLLTPVYLDVGAGLDWFRYLERYQSLPPSDRRVADLIGVEERFITRMASGASGGMQKHGETGSSHAQRLALHRRFYTALALYGLVREDGLGTVAEQFGVNRGLLQSLQQQAATYAGMVTIFCNRLGWVHMERLLSSFQSRLFHGVAEELVDLLRLQPAVNAQRARALYSGGYSSVSALSTARACDIARLLQRAIPFERSEVSVSHQSERRTIQLDDGSYVNEVEAAPIIIEKAKDLLRSDLAYVYGTNIVVVPKSSESVQDTSRRQETSPDPSQIVPKSPTSPVVSKTENEPFVKCNMISEENLSRMESQCTNPSEEPSLNQSTNYNEESLTNAPPIHVPCALSTPAPCLTSERNSNLIHLPRSAPSISQSNFQHTSFKRPATRELNISPNLETPPVKMRSLSVDHASTLFSEVEETFVLTSQIAALLDNVPPNIPETAGSNSEFSQLPNKLSNDDNDGHTDITKFVPLSTFDYEMNDTLTLSMLDNACNSYSVQSDICQSDTSTGETLLPIRDPFSAKKHDRSGSRLSDLFGSPPPPSPDDADYLKPLSPMLS